MSELALYVIATVVVLAGVAYFFIKQREQEALLNNKPKRNEPKKQKAKKETKEPKEIKTRKPRPAAKEEPAAPLSKRAEKRREKEEDETKNVLDFLKGKKFSSEKATSATTQAKVRSAPPVEEKKAAPKPQYDSEESGSDTEDYEKVKRKIKSTTTKEKPVESEEENGQTKKGKNKPKFFTKQEKDEHEAAIQAKKDARAKAKEEYEARKNMTPEEKKAAAKARRIAERAAEKAAQAEDGEFKSQRERRPRKDRAEGDNGEEDESDERRKSKYPPREPDQAPVFASEYETPDMDNILNNLTQYYKSNPDAHRPKQHRAKKSAPVESEESKADSE